MLLRIEDARYLGNFTFALCFNDGRKGNVDIRPLFEDEPKGVFAPLKDDNFVRSFSLCHGTLCWPGELDVAPEYFYFLAFRDVPELHHLFFGWGYLKELKSA